MDKPRLIVNPWGQRFFYNPKTGNQETIGSHMRICSMCGRRSLKSICSRCDEPRRDKLRQLKLKGEIT